MQISPSHEVRAFSFQVRLLWLYRGQVAFVRVLPLFIKGFTPFNRNGRIFVGLSESATTPFP